MKLIFRLLRARPGPLIAGVITLILVNGLQLLIPQIIRQITDQLTVSDGSQVATSATTIIALAFLIMGLRYCWRVFLFGLARQLKHAVRRELYGQLLRIHYLKLQQFAAGDLLARFSSDAEAIGQACGTGALFLSDAIFLLLFALIAMSWISPWLTLICTVPLLLIAVLLIITGPVIQRRSTIAQEQLGTVAEVVRAAVSTIRTYKAGGNEQIIVNAFATANSAFQQTQKELLKSSFWIEPTSTLIVGGTAILALWQGGNQILAGTLTVGSFVAFNSYLALVAWPMSAFGHLVNLVQRGVASANRIDQFLHAICEVSVDSGKAIQDWTLEAHHLVVHYPGAERSALHDISFTIQPLQQIGILGLTGSGKSSIAHVLTRIIDCYSGEVRCGSISLNEIALTTLRQGIVVVPQQGFVLQATVRENVQWGDVTISDPQLEAALRQVQLWHEVQSFPNGLDTIIGERGITLSGGQRQRLILARILFMQPKVVILDDALSAVDSVTEEAIWNNLADWCKARTTIVISNRVRTVSRCQEVWVLSHGTITERGTASTLRRKDGLFSHLARLQALEEQKAV